MPFYIAYYFPNHTATTTTYTLSLHDALPICARVARGHEPDRLRAAERRHRDRRVRVRDERHDAVRRLAHDDDGSREPADRKSTRLNSSHVEISYAVFCLKKKKYLDLI